ncbi:MAG: DNA polymerase III subunit delta [Bacillota bacterium]
MTYEEFAQELARGEVRPAYCFAGEEAFLVEEGARKVVEAVLPGPERGFSLVELTAEAGPEEVRRALSSPSFFGAKRVVRLHDLGRLGAEALEVLAAGARRLPPGTHLVALGRPDGRRSAGKEFLSAVTLVECPLRKKGEAVAWAKARAAGLGLAPAAEIAAAVVEAVGPHLGAVAGELAKLAAYLGGEKRPLHPAELSSLLGRAPEEDVFKLVEAAAEGRAEEALRILADLLARGEHEGALLALLERQVRLLLLAGHLHRAGRRTDEIAAALGVPRFVAERLLTRSDRFPPARCRAILARMLRADVRGKTGEGDPRMELELVVLAMAGRIN